MKDFIYKYAPNFFQNFMVSMYNRKAYGRRQGGNYKKYLENFKNNYTLDLEELECIQRRRFGELVEYAIANSSYYKSTLRGIDGVSNLDNIKKLPIVNKEDLRNRIEDIYTIKASEGGVAKTGGTTGKSLSVIYVNDNSQERHAMLDAFRGQTGYKLGKKTAWFSGKAILTNRDVRKNRFWKSDFYHKVKYYSTFHMHSRFLKYYIEDLISFAPEYIVGFPSTISEIARYGLANNLPFPEGVVVAVYPTAETVTKELREVIEEYFHTRVYDQYASSEGAPFIFECKNGKLHFELQSGVFEVLDDNNEECDYGRLVVTAFATEGTPLIRYDIGDQIEKEHGTCSCGNNNPLVKKIHGRIDDFIYSQEVGKINLGNISNSLKDTYGIVKFQVIQNELESIDVKMMVDDKLYTKKIEEIFLSNLRQRVGEKMRIELEIVDNIPVEVSGKFRMVKNNIKHLLS